MPAHRLDDPHGHAHRAYDIHEPTLVLVRPDNYIGCVSTDPDDVTAYLKLIGQ